MATAKISAGVVAAFLIFASCAIITAEGGIISGILHRLTDLCDMTPGEWETGTGTFYYGGSGGACGFGSHASASYTAASTLIWQSGAACGSCYEVRCVSPASACIQGAVVKVTVTDFCPPSFPNSGHCGTDKHHLDLGANMFTQIAAKSIGVIGLEYRQVPCERLPTITVSLRGNAFGWLEVIIARVPAYGSIGKLELKCAGGDWEELSDSWGGSFTRSGSRLTVPISLRLTVGGVCSFVAEDCIKSLNFGGALTCTYT